MGKEDLSKLSKEELISLLLASHQSEESLREKVDELGKTNGELSRANKDLQEKVRLLEEEVRQKKLIIKRYNLEMYFSKSDSVPASKLFNASKAMAKATGGGSPAAKPGEGDGTGDAAESTAKKPRKKHVPSKGLSEEELEKLSAGNPVITNEDTRQFDPDKFTVVNLGDRISYAIVRIPARTLVYKIVTRARKIVDRATGTATIVRPAPINVSNSRFHSSVYAYAAFLKFFGGVPVHRYVRLERSQGIEIPLRTGYNLVNGGAAMLEGLYDHIGRKYVGSGRIPELHIDESTIKAIDITLKKDGSGRKTSYMLLYRGILDRKCIFSYYEFAEDRELEEVRRRLRDAHGIVVTTDAYKAYGTILRDLEKSGVRHQTCVQHAIRYFLRAVDTSTRDLSESESVAAFAVQRLFRLFTLESEFRDRGLSGKELLEARNAEGASRTQLEEVRDYLATVVPAGEPLRKAITYFDNNYGTMSTFLENPDASIHNNMAEEGFKILATDRHNFMFVRGRIGGKACAIHLTIQQLALSNGLDPCEYEEFLLERVRAADFDNDYDALLPWSEGIKDRIAEYREDKRRLFGLTPAQMA